MGCDGGADLVSHIRWCGLPQIAELAGDAKSYAERLFKFPGSTPWTSKTQRKPSLNRRTWKVCTSTSMRFPGPLT